MIREDAFPMRLLSRVLLRMFSIYLFFITRLWYIQRLTAYWLSPCLLSSFQFYKIWFQHTLNQTRNIVAVQDKLLRQHASNNTNLMKLIYGFKDFSLSKPVVASVSSAHTYVAERVSVNTQYCALAWQKCSHTRTDPSLCSEGVWQSLDTVLMHAEPRAQPL